MNHLGYPILVLTFRGRNRYLKATLGWLRKKVRRKEIIVLTDFDAPNTKKIRFIEGRDDNWAINLHNCLKSPEIMKHKYVFVLIEDLIPTKTVNFDIIDRSVEYMEVSQIDCIVFPTFQCYWGQAVGRVESADRKVELYSTPAHFKYFSQLQPALWRLEYFQRLVDTCMGSGGDPWGFEKLNIGGAHAVSEYCWPNMIGGYLESGRVNKKFLAENIRNSFVPLKLKILLCADLLIQKLRGH